MAYPLKKLLMHEFSFDKEVKALLKFLGERWEISAAPKCYQEFLKTYEDYAGMEELDEEALLKSFDGHDGAGTLSLPFPTRVSLPHVAYDDTNQGCRPLETLIGAVLGYGMLLGMRLSEVDPNSDVHYRMTWMGHAYSELRWLTDEKDIKLVLLIMDEIEEYRTNFKERHMEIHDKFKKRKHELRCKSLKVMLDDFFKGENKRVMFKENTEMHTAIRELTYTCNKPADLKDVIKELGYSVGFKGTSYTIAPRTARKK